MSTTKIIWLTGLPGSGKSTIAELLKKKLNEKDKTVKMLDGDEVRNSIHSDLGFSVLDVLKNSRLVIHLCKETLGKFDFIIVPLVAPFPESRAYARILLGQHYIQCFVDTPLEICMQRDPKGLYSKAKQGIITDFWGYAKDCPYYPPTDSEIHLAASQQTVEESTQIILDYLQNTPV
jgi:adenylylsulfate kinase